MTTHKTKEQRREQIINAALQCFSEKGYYEASMDDIVREANLSKGSLYWHFKNKRELFLSIVDFWMNEFAEGLESTLENAGTPSQKLYALVLAVKESTAIRPELLRAQMEFYSMAVRDEELQSRLKEGYEINWQFLQMILHEGIASGEFRPVPVEQVARLTMAYMDGALLHREINGSASVAEIMDEIYETLIVLLKA